jgi:hypothetical protein
LCAHPSPDAPASLEQTQKKQEEETEDVALQDELPEATHIAGLHNYVCTIKSSHPFIRSTNWRMVGKNQLRRRNARTSIPPHEFHIVGYEKVFKEFVGCKIIDVTPGLSLLCYFCFLFSFIFYISPAITDPMGRGACSAGGASPHAS